MEFVGPALDVGVYVRDIKVMLDFYRERMGWPFIGVIDFPDGRRQHRMRVGQSVFKLWECPPDMIPPAATPGLRGQCGIRYVTAEIADIDGTVVQLAAKGVHPTAPVREATPGVWIAFFQDPEGNTVELLERRKKPSA